ncbi:cation:proton antiporter [Pseudosulfitobacter pseudonitzschiae]|uniref:Sodium:proton antiporter n=1 Tax=Pseudosulfitobacter pseudonitzschiae TaxID=1402135 RepID=A0A073IXZ9_9RHOB|nr:cation:proton antiporter [Pseudosulfitobacter pseudonitzschiae]KEJ95248.1 sodium:proton antiporter [Pseudosulfitobacter pseudonitzschiae]MBM1816719.1 cation:proton antiporter [Pseudosulfitobacter pseudonitzschiae]MBM1833529.1 cation:proton antiporter [Pseudosulfitobacter pseudonitzschiae]MBM1838396.1 cation:proton antiporter [Pseudosulfitobacter pseudonitzschiae]MBM1843446.1 cation:proton antiporter [Pseudosulfitobacter pseudonitzschiae]
MDIVLVTTIIASLFLVIGVAEPLAARLRLPFSVILAMLGILIGGGAIFFLRTELTDALNPIAEAILGLPIRSNVFLYVFLPTLLFQATLGMNLRRMLDDWVPILVLAVVAVVVATLTVGYALSWASSLPLAACLLIGAIVSTTDPSAVVSIFRSISAPRRLARIIEGESLLNDAAAIALFGLFIGFVMLGVPDPNLSDALMRFPMLIAGGALTGWLAARLAVGIMAFFNGHELAQISISVALPYLVYIGAEQSIGASGVIAVVTAGLTLNLTGPGRLPPQAWANLRELWGVLAHWAGALIFILAALLIPRLLEGVRVTDFALIGVVIVAAIAARALILFGLLPLLTSLRISPAIERPYRAAILWGGLRGAVTLALALAVTESLRVPLEVKRVVGILATGFTLFTLVVQGTTLRSVIGWLGLDRLSPIDEALSRQVVAVALQTVREDVARATENYELTRDIVRSEAKQFGERLDETVKAAEDSVGILDRDRITLGLIALAGHERDTILARVRERTITARMAEQVLSDADRLIEGAQAGGRSGYQLAARRSVAYGKVFRLAVMLRNRLRLPAPLGRMTADRFELLLSQRLILRDLSLFIDNRIVRIHGRRVADLLHELLSRRIEAVETALEGLRLQYPGYAEKLERRIIRRTALRFEEREYMAMREDGLIGAEVYTALMQSLAARRAAAEDRPRLDIALQREELVKQFPLFADFDETALKRLGRALQTRYVNAGDAIILKDSTAKSVFFIASGAVELESAGKTLRLGRGEMFGQLAILMNKTRRAEVRAIAPSTLLVLDEARFRRLLDQSETVRKAVLASGEKRGVTLAGLQSTDP